MRPTHRTRLRDGAWLVGLYLATRLVWSWLGVRADPTPLEWYWQYLDADLLRDRLAESLWFLHSQPPGLNALLGLAGTLAGDLAPVLAGLWIAGGAAMALALMSLLRQVGCGRIGTMVATLVLANGLPWVVYERWLFYDFPCAALVVLAGWSLFSLDRRPGVACGVFAACGLGLTLTRSLFHPAWLAASLLLLVWAAPPRVRRLAVGCSAAALLVTAGLVVKNGVVFGVWGTSSWLGMSLAKMTTARLPPAERDRLIATGEISRFAAVRPFSPVATYERVLGRTFDDCAIPALGRRTRSGGAPNYNHAAYLEIGRQSRVDALTAMQTHPDLYLDSVRRAALQFLRSPLAYPAFRPTLEQVRALAVGYQVTFGRMPVATVLLLTSMALAGVGFGAGVRSGNRALAAASAWYVVTVVWLVVVGSMVEIGENQRFRFVVTPAMWAVLAAAAGWSLSRRRRRENDPAH